MRAILDLLLRLLRQTPSPPMIHTPPGLEPTVSDPVNAAGLALIKAFEGCGLEAYVDPVGIWTIGYGHTASAGLPIPKAGMTITQAQADALLKDDLWVIRSTVLSWIKVPTNENERAALISLAFNIGVSAFRGSTALKRLNAGDRAGAAEALTWWNKGTVDGKKVELPGLTRRRAAERDLFLSKDI